ncbi:STAS domain-containing protein [Limisphaera ngatamarikiensis]|uniref:STAS domain-containing protein n=1 Tax=Limisphaera ngatamarikiensis TaxID=1324935 RepID=A0A6M1RXG6_9BACT|nr:STAS domain-containing protein [Limisphaera ngatamarikiensis]NGO39452.1 STAS domain-containing protein [Limisphaera ngatamarikiensis]
MSLPPAKVMVMVNGREVWLRITGHANFAAAPDFKAVVQGLLQKGYRRFKVDMSDCILLDSTFLGLLCRLGIQLHQSGDPQAGVDLINPTPRVAQLIESLGVTEYLHIVQEPRTLPAGGETTETTLGGGGADRVELARTSLEAHQTLMSINPANEARFKDVARFLQEDLQKLEEAKPGNSPSGS